MRAALALVAWLLTLVSGLAVTIAALATLLLGLGGAEADADDCRCGATSQGEADAVVTGRVAGRRDDRLLLVVDAVERGRVARQVAVRSFGVELRPWCRYRLFLFADRGGFDLTDEVAPERLGLARPAGFASFGALPSTVRLGMAAVPLLVASLVVLVLERRDARFVMPAVAPSG